MDDLEIEVKFFLTDFSRIRRKLAASDARCHGAVLERNIRFETETDVLIRQGALLRLREDGRCRLTFKSATHDPGSAARDGFKVFREIEIQVDDAEKTIRLLAALGFHPRQIYEKERETWKLGGTEICLDRMPFGHFVEIEGNKPDIRRISSQLEMPWKERMVTNYLAIFAHLRRAFDLPFADVTFDNFSKVPRDFAPAIRSLEREGRE
jgi:adenylate cyclase class 2